MRGWNHRATIGNVLRNLAVLIVNTAETIDPQPDVTIHPFNVHTSSGTQGAEARITWHAHLKDSDFKETA
jgi:hypothetical protein